MGVGDDGSGLAVDDEMGVGVAAGGGGEGGIGVEAAAVVVITLLAVLGNAMVVATLVRRSLLHHPSNRLVLSLTGSNLVLTVVVLPGMVTSLLMTPASPSKQPPTLQHHFNNSGISPSHDTIESIPLLKRSDADTAALSQQPNESVISLRNFTNNSSSLQESGEESSPFPSNSVLLEDYSDDPMTFSHSQGTQEVTTPIPEFFTTELPIYLEVSSSVMDSAVPLHRDVSILSQELQNSQPSSWQGEIVRPQNLHQQEVDHHQKSIRSREFQATPLLRDKFGESAEDGGITPETAGYVQRQMISRDDVVHLIDAKENRHQETQGKEIRSLSENDRKIKSSTSENIRLDKDVLAFIRNEEKIVVPQSNSPHMKIKTKLKGRSKVSPQDVFQEGGGELQLAEKLPQEYTEYENDSGLAVHGEEQARHPPNRRRKQGTRHYQHRKQRLRRNRDDSQSSGTVLVVKKNDSDKQKAGDTELIRSERESLVVEVRNPEWEENNNRNKNVEGLKGEQGNPQLNSSGVGHLREKVHVRIEQQQGGGKREHVIIVRGVQELKEEQAGKQMVVVVVDQEELHQQQRIQVKVTHHNAHQRNQQSGSENQLEEPSEPKASALNLSTEKISDGDNLQANFTRPKKNDHLLQRERVFDGHQQGEPLNNQELNLELQDEAGKEVEEIQQVYGGVEWETDRWEGGRILCQGAAFFTNLVTAASALTVAVIAIDRYLAIVRPLVYGVMVTRGRCLLMLIWCWSQALLTALPPLLGWARYERREPYGRCGVAWGESPSYTAVWTISVFLIPFSIMTVCYYHILQVARNKCRRIRVGKMSETSPPHTPDPTAACLDGFPFPLSVAHLTSPPLGGKLASPRPPSPTLRKLSSFGNLTNSSLGSQAHCPAGSHASHWNGAGHPLVKNSGTSSGVLDSRLGGIPCRSYSVSGMLRAVDSATNTNDPSHKPKRKLGDFGRSRSLCQVPQQPPRPCLRRVQSTFSVRHTLKKLSLGTRRPSWSWEGSPSKGFWTVFVVMGAHLVTWGPYTCMAIAEAILGRGRLQSLPPWVMVTCTLLLFTASVFYPIVYGLYNRNIRKEVLTCLCPTWARKRGSQARRPSTLPSYSGSVLDFTSLRQRSASDKPELCPNPANGITGTIATISSRVGSLACPMPLMIMGEDDTFPVRGYNLNLRKPSQDSGTVMVGGEDQDSDVDTPAPTPRQYTTRRVSAPSVLSTVKEDPHSTTVCIEDNPKVGRHYSISGRNLPSHRKMTVIPLPESFNVNSVVGSSLRRSRSLDKIHSPEKDIVLDSIAYRSLRKKRIPPVVRETQFNTPVTSERVQRRRGSIAVMKVSAIPEDCGVTEYPEVTDSGRGSVDSGRITRPRIVNGRGSVDSTDLTKTFSLRCRGSTEGPEQSKAHAFNRRGSVDSTELAMARSKKRENRDSVDLGKNPASRQISIDEGIGSECLPEESNWE
ncbi:uncharacterized protein LOC135194946 isoform X2 [Macrobrachium nipponense]|uniref:uncharacterized protein LOC135194946 isoform X2 n=1 Tax=Macrobrachium nipponense TaxID=159736 RepID=UPI0030C7E770